MRAPARSVVAANALVRAASLEARSRRASSTEIPLVAPATPDYRDPVLSGRQKVTVLVLLMVMVASFVVAPLGTAIAINAVLTVFFLAANVFKLALIRRTLDEPGAITVHHDDLAALRDQDLPIYTLLIPVYREAAVVHQLIKGISRLDYPPEKLDVKVLVEADDEETPAALAGIALPSHIAVLTIPNVGPQGKPRACNYGLVRAVGKYVVIYDAEDRPEPDQLLKAVAGFHQLPPDVVCLQAQLNYFNRTQNLLTRWFSAEYSVWFDHLLPGLQVQQHPIPLGGTSNHLVTERLRELGGWNAYNVTEDADLGMRIYRRGWKTAMIDSTTFEEANSRPRNWVRQRSRWAKGYMQTYLWHTRHPVRLWRDMGWRGSAAFHLFFGAATLCLLINPVYWLLTLFWFTKHWHIIELLFPTALLDIGVASTFIGNAVFVMVTVAGCIHRRHYDDVKWALMTPFYWILMSIGAWKGFLQLFFKPYYWEKTTHGFFLLDQPTSEAPRLTAGEA